LRENADIIFRGKGEWANTVKLVEKNGELKIIKKTFDKKTYLREKKYYKSYINNSSKLLLPKMIFHKNNTIEIDFLKMKSFQRLINEGSLDMKQSLSHVRIINKELKVFYRKRSTLIHSDLSPENIFIKGNEYYLIDFADSRKAEMQYDKYMLLRSVIFSFNHNKVNKKTNIYSLRREHLSKLLKVNTSKIIKFEEQFKELDIKKHPKHATETFQKKNQHLYTINKPIYSI
jgi:5-methylthioribose kinase